MDYKLTEAEKATMDSLKEKGKVFGIQCIHPNHAIHRHQSYWTDSAGGYPEILSPEAAHALMCRRAWEKLGQNRWKVRPTADGWLLCKMDNKTTLIVGVRTYDDMLAALIAALEDTE